MLAIGWKSPSRDFYRDGRLASPRIHHSLIPAFSFNLFSFIYRVDFKNFLHIVSHPLFRALTDRAAHFAPRRPYCRAPSQIDISVKQDWKCFECGICASRPATFWSIVFFPSLCSRAKTWRWVQAVWDCTGPWCEERTWTIKWEAVCMSMRRVVDCVSIEATPVEKYVTKAICNSYPKKKNYRHAA